MEDGESKKPNESQKPEDSKKAAGVEEQKAEVVEDFDIVEPKYVDSPRDAPNNTPAKDNQDAADAGEPKTLVESPEAAVEVSTEAPTQDPPAFDEIILDEPSPPKKRTPPKAKKAFAEDKNHGEKGNFKPLKEYIDPEYWDLSDSSEDEGMPDYKIGGYHAVHVGEVFLD